MPGTPDPAVAAMVPSAASWDGEGDGGNTVIQEATSGAGRGRGTQAEDAPRGSGHWFALFSKLALGRKQAWQSLGLGVFPKRCWM